MHTAANRAVSGGGALARCPASTGLSERCRAGASPVPPVFEVDPQGGSLQPGFILFDDFVPEGEIELSANLGGDEIDVEWRDGTCSNR